MRKDSRTSISVQLLIHGVMGAILGAVLGLGLIITNRQIFQLIASSSLPSISMALFIGFFAFVVSTGATISGFFFTTIELAALEARQQTERVKKRRSSGT